MRCRSSWSRVATISLGVTHEMIDITKEIRDQLAAVDDFCWPVRNYFYWEPHCYDIPVCSAVRSGFDASDGVDRISQELSDQP